ncbi:MAG TPA: hypothetical protein VGB50_11560 [Flavobacterium sp.]|jgi:hypothetical protein
MILRPKFGVDKLLFGMKREDVIKIYGKADKEFRDDENNMIWLYNLQQFRLTFYEDEGFRLGYIICTNPTLLVLDRNIIGEDVAEVKAYLQQHGLKDWESEDYDMAENHFNEENWTILQSEFGKIVKIETGAIINDKDEFDWKFKA